MVRMGSGFLRSWHDALAVPQRSTRVMRALAEESVSWRQISSRKKRVLVASNQTYYFIRFFCHTSLNFGHKQITISFTLTTCVNWIECGHYEASLQSSQHRDGKLRDVGQQQSNHISFLQIKFFPKSFAQILRLSQQIPISVLASSNPTFLHKQIVYSLAKQISAIALFANDNVLTIAVSLSYFSHFE
jgi:hypothetical protein